MSGAGVQFVESPRQLIGKGTQHLGARAGRGTPRRLGHQIGYQADRDHAQAAGGARRCHAPSDIAALDPARRIEPCEGAFEPDHDAFAHRGRRLRHAQQQLIVAIDRDDLGVGAAEVDGERNRHPFESGSGGAERQASTLATDRIRISRIVCSTWRRQRSDAVWRNIERRPGGFALEPRLISRGEAAAIAQAHNQRPRVMPGIGALVVDCVRGSIAQVEYPGIANCGVGNLIHGQAVVDQRDRDRENSETAHHRRSADGACSPRNTQCRSGLCRSAPDRLDLRRDRMRLAQGERRIDEGVVEMTYRIRL